MEEQINKGYKINIFIAVIVMTVMLIYSGYFQTSSYTTQYHKKQQFHPPDFKPDTDGETGRNNNISQDKYLNGIILFWKKNYLFGALGLNKKSSVYFDCGYYQCELTKDRSKLEKSRVIVFEPRSSRETDLPPTKEWWQRWAVQTRESPQHEKIPKYFDGKANWTFDYSTQSDISFAWGFTVPIGQYDRLPFYNQYLLNTSNRHRDEVRDSRGDLYQKNYRELLTHKSKLIMWIVSNCGVKERNKYVQDLVKSGLKLEKFGRCGKPFPCQRDKGCEAELFLQYKFYVAFENSHCDDYISEKLWKSLHYGMVPIVMGPSIKNYQKLLPPNSFLHVKNFSSPAKLAEYITYLDNNNEAYIKYHEWRATFQIIYNGDIHVLWACEMCKKMHDPPTVAHQNMSSNWRPNVHCFK